jgi:hypothetical protein
MANAAVLKTAVRKDLGVRIPRPPLYVTTSCAASDPGKHVGTRRRLDTCLDRRHRSTVLTARSEGIAVGPSRVIVEAKLSRHVEARRAELEDGRPSL